MTRRARVADRRKRVGVAAVLRWLLEAMSALLLTAAHAQGESPRSASKVGDEYRITSRYETSQRDSNGRPATRGGNNALVERVIGLREGALELEYDLPKAATVEDRSRDWQFPIRVLKPSRAPMQLLNGTELDVRLAAGREAAHFTRADCGRWIFTWQAFRIECDPQAVISTIESLDLGSIDLRDGASYVDAAAGSPGKLRRTGAGPDGETFATTMEVDPEGVRRARAASDVVVNQILGKPVTSDAALREHAAETVSERLRSPSRRTPRGSVRRRTKVTRLEIDGPNGRHETQTATETVERRLVSEVSR